jgi:hypothetical protein
MRYTLSKEEEEAITGEEEDEVLTMDEETTKARNVLQDGVTGVGLEPI